MTSTAQEPRERGGRLIGTIDDAQHSALEAVRKFVDTVDGAFPDLREDGPRRKIIDSAFDMVEKMMDASTELAQNIVDVAQKALRERKDADAAAR